MIHDWTWGFFFRKLWGELGWNNVENTWPLIQHVCNRYITAGYLFLTNILQFPATITISDIYGSNELNISEWKALWTLQLIYVCDMETVGLVRSWHFVFCHHHFSEWWPAGPRRATMSPPIVFDRQPSENMM